VDSLQYQLESMQLQYEALLVRNAELQQRAGFVIDRTVVAGGFAMAHSLSRKHSAAQRQFHLTDSGCGVWGLGFRFMECVV
jgi:cytochrome c-type biogenesis protein CcmE